MSFSTERKLGGIEDVGVRESEFKDLKLFGRDLRWEMRDWESRGEDKKEEEVGYQGIGET